MVFTPETEKHLLAHHRDFEAFADAMVQSHQGRFDDVFWGFVRQHAPADVARVVDLGTGPGLLLPELASHFEGAEVIGVDGQPAMLRRAERLAAEHERLRVLAHDLGSDRPLDLPEGSVDVAVASVLVHELQVPTRLFDSVARVLRPGGALLIYDWVRRPLADYFEGERPETLDQFTHFSEHCRYTPEDLAFLLERSGFSVSEWLARRNGRFVLMAAIRTDDAPRASL